MSGRVIPDTPIEYSNSEAHAAFNDFPASVYDHTLSNGSSPSLRLGAKIDSAGR